MPFDRTLSSRLPNLLLMEGPRYEYYLNSYPHLLNFFKRRLASGSLDESDAQAAVAAIYAWMPQASPNKHCCEKFGDATPIIEKAATGNLEPGEVATLARFVGGSLVAASKFLHFLNPAEYAMWDKNVAYAAYRMKQHEDRFSDESTYLTYLVDLRQFELPGDTAFWLDRTLPTASLMRQKEFAIFNLGITELTGS